MNLLKRLTLLERDLKHDENSAAAITEISRLVGAHEKDLSQGFEIVL
jgi:hypothetical protein